MRRVFGALLRRGLVLLVMTLAVSLVACSSTATSTVPVSGQSTRTPHGSASATTTPQASCASALPGSTPFSGVSGVPGLQAPAGSYISSATTSGGGVGQYTVHTYTLCFPGAESAIDGGILTPTATPTSTIGYLIHGGWTLNNLFPDPTSFAYLDICSAPHICVNTSGVSDPFTFAGFDQFASPASGLMTTRLQVADLATPICLNDVGYYAGTPKYTLFEDSVNATSGSIPAYHFQMPPATRVSTFAGGGTAGSTYDYYCSAGSHDTVLAFLTQSMQNVGWTVTPTATGFSATDGSSPMYSIDLSILYPNNYSLRVFVPQ